MTFSQGKMHVIVQLLIKDGALETLQIKSKKQNWFRKWTKLIDNFSLESAIVFRHGYKYSFFKLKHKKIKRIDWFSFQAEHNAFSHLFLIFETIRFAYLKSANREKNIQTNSSKTNKHQKIILNHNICCEFMMTFLDLIPSDTTFYLESNLYFELNRTFAMEMKFLVINLIRTSQILAITSRKLFGIWFMVNFDWKIIQFFLRKRTWV